jgi:hypothetical protein
MRDNENVKKYNLKDNGITWQGADTFKNSFNSCIESLDLS